MKNVTVLFRRLAWCVGLAAGCALAQGNAPVEPFQAVHLIRLDMQKPDAEKTLMKAISEMNRAIAKAGCAKCVYQLWKVAGEQNGTFNFLQISSWPGRAVYDKVHNSPEYEAASKSWPELRSVVQEELYNRYVEVPAAQQR